ncbi:MAG TPA: phosphoribosyltransferase family protein [Intrasporangium sp.]|nr:phosphoribosyltransferase family protein [Intrasporangium sp.]
MPLQSLLDLLLPAECAGCHRTGSPWCRRCGRALNRLAFPDGPRLVTPDPAPPGMPAVYAWGTYADPLRAAVTAWKDEGRRDLVDQLVPLLRPALSAALTDGPQAVAAALMVPAPSSRRSRRTRGDVPLHDLARRAAADPPFTGLQVLAVLHEQRGVRDQAGLGTTARRANVTGAFHVRKGLEGAVNGRDCIVVDDVMTTGATLVECTRALEEAGARRVLAVTIAVPRRRRRRPPRHASAGAATL